MTEPYTPSLTDRRAQEIRHADGAHHMGAGLLAEALMPFIAQVRAEALRDAARDSRQFLSTYEAAEWLDNRANSIERGEQSR